MAGQEAGNVLGKMQVIVRAFEDEPVQLVAVSVKDDYVEVARDVRLPTLRFPRSYVYQYDSEAFARLKEAWDRKDSDILRTLWREASRANFDMEGSQ